MGEDPSGQKNRKIVVYSGTRTPYCGGMTQDKKAAATPVKLEKGERLLDTVKGWEAAVKAVRVHAESFNESNGAGRMVPEGNGLAAHDNEGSGEFIEARGRNFNTAETNADIVFDMVVIW